MPTLRSLAISLSLLAACASSAPARPAEKTPTASEKPMQRQREKLPPAARDALVTRMERHGDQMLLLMESVVLLNYEVTLVLAEELAAEPKLGRPAPGEKDTLNALLPAAFFTHQEHMTEKARALAGAARGRDDRQLLAAFTSLAETCVGCHSAYLYEDSDLPADHDPWLHAPEGQGGESEQGDGEAPDAHPREL